MLGNKAIQITLMLPVAMILMFSSADYASSRARPHSSPKPNNQELSTRQKLEAEQRLWDLGYWAGTVDGKFDYMDHGQLHRARTPTGTFKVQRKIKGWRLSSLGLMYYPNYIFNGLAIHGSFSIPTQPASHGCIRVPMYAAKQISSLLPIGIEVLVYDSSRSRKDI